MLKSEPQAATSKQLDYWKLFRDLPDAYLLFEANDPTFTVAEMNRARELLTGINRADCIGRPLLEAFPNMSEQFRQNSSSDLLMHLQEVLGTGKPKYLSLMQYEASLPDGSVVTQYWQRSYIPVRSDDGTITHILAATRDITDEALAEREMASIEGRLAAALAIGKVGSWAWDMDNNLIIGDQYLARLFSIDKKILAQGINATEFLLVIHADDRERVRQAFHHSMSEQLPFEVEYRATTPSGQIRWMLARGQAEDQDGRRLFQGVMVDITERHELQAQIELARRQDRLNRRESKILQQRNAELVAVSRTKDEFVALASHQLRTPATAVKQYIGMVLQGYVGEVSELQSQMLHKAFESNERQIQIINQILNAARVDTGSLVLSAMPIDLRTLVQGIADDIRPLMDQYQHTFTVTLPRVSVPVAGDISYLRMAIENLLHNAIIYTPRGGTIELTLQRAGGKARLSVTDSGVGIKKADLGKLFTKFSRINNPLSVQAGGSGIGLYLAAEIVRLHQGSVTVESTLHKGTTFAILLPLGDNEVKVERSILQAKTNPVAKRSSNK